MIVAYRKSYVCTSSLHSLLIAYVNRIYIYLVEAERGPMDAMMVVLEDLSFCLMLYSLPTSLWPMLTRSEWRCCRCTTRSSVIRKYAVGLSVAEYDVIGSGQGLESDCYQ